MRRKLKFGAGLLFIPAAAIAAYALTKLAALSIPTLGSNAWAYALVQLMVAVALLLIPYLILKAGFFAAHAKNRREREISLKDLPRPEYRRRKKNKHRRVNERRPEMRVS
jgi:hypothetical protein